MQSLLQMTQKLRAKHPRHQLWVCHGSPSLHIVVCFHLCHGQIKDGYNIAEP